MVPTSGVIMTGTGTGTATMSTSVSCTRMASCGGVCGCGGVTSMTLSPMFDCVIAGGFRLVSRPPAGRALG